MESRIVYSQCDGLNLSQSSRRWLHRETWLRDELSSLTLTHPTEHRADRASRIYEVSHGILQEAQEVRQEDTVTQSEGSSRSTRPQEEEEEEGQGRVNWTGRC